MDLDEPDTSTPSTPGPRWLWVYGFELDGTAIGGRVDELHLFAHDTVPEDLVDTPAFDLPPSILPLCQRTFFDRLPFWRLFNTGKGDPMRLVTIAGNPTMICPRCKAISKELKK